MPVVRSIEQDEVPYRFAMVNDDEEIGRFDLLIEDTVPDRGMLGTLPPTEMFIVGLKLPWQDGDWLAVGTRMLADGMKALPASAPRVVQANTNLEVHESPWRRIHLLEALGFDLFQEKHGYFWVERDQPLDVEIETRSLEEVGDDVYRSVMARIPSGGLDRNDNYYYAAAGPENWARVMLTFAEPEDRSSWLVGYERGVPVGMAALSAFDEPDTATISYIGVLPNHRGRGLGRKLLMAATAAARSRGFTRIISDVDVLNVPMRTVMVACGHQPDLRPWHRWAHWLRLDPT